jgi:hypothetical protein
LVAHFLKWAAFLFAVFPFSFRTALEPFAALLDYVLDCPVFSYASLLRGKERRRVKADDFICKEVTLHKEFRIITASVSPLCFPVGCFKVFNRKKKQ